MRGGRFFARISCVWDLDRFTLFGVVLTEKLPTVCCLCMFVFVALSGARGVAKPSLFSFKADLVRRVGVYIRLFLGVICWFKCCMFSFPIFGVRGKFRGVFFGVLNSLWNIMLSSRTAIELRLIFFSAIWSWQNVKGFLVREQINIKPIWGMTR